MQGFENDGLFVELTHEEEASVAGGAIFIPPLVVAAVKVAVAVGSVAGAISAVTNVISRFSGWLGGRGNGIIVGDRKGSSRDLRRAGDVGDDLPHGWNWGVRHDGRWIAGGYNGPKA